MIFVSVSFPYPPWSHPVLYPVPSSLYSCSSHLCLLSVSVLFHLCSCLQTDGPLGRLFPFPSLSRLCLRPVSVPSPSRLCLVSDSWRMSHSVFCLCPVSILSSSRLCLVSISASVSSLSPPLSRLYLRLCIRLCPVSVSVFWPMSHRVVCRLVMAREQVAPAGGRRFTGWERP